VKIEIDSDGYPTPDSVAEVEGWELEDGEMSALLDAVADYFNDCGYGRARRRGNVWRFATGGWSGCEELIGALPAIVVAVAWRSSHRGGLHVYALDGVK
jgi:hypothetical protein